MATLAGWSRPSDGAASTAWPAVPAASRLYSARLLSVLLTFALIPSHCSRITSERRAEVLATSLTDPIFVRSRSTRSSSATGPHLRASDAIGLSHSLSQDCPTRPCGRHVSRWRGWVTTHGGRWPNV